MKQRFLWIWLLVPAFVLLLSCESESIPMDPQTQNDSGSKTTLEAIGLETVPQIAQTIDGRLGKSTFPRSHASKGDSEFWLDMDHVMKAVDSVGNISYALSLISETYNPKEFYNLIVTERLDGSEVAHFVIRYKFANGDKEQFALDPEKNFDGVVDIYSLTEFAAAYGSITDRYGEPDPCYDDIGENDYTPATNDGGSGSSSGGTSGGSSTTGSTTSGTSFSVTRTHISVSGVQTSSGTKGSSGTIYGGVGEFKYHLTCTGCQTEKNYNLSGKEGDCPDTNVVVPVKEETIVVVTPDTPIKDMADFLKCFSTSKGATVTVYANEPNPGSGDTHAGQVVGHTFVSIQQGSSTATFGFYPATDNIMPVWNPSDPSAMGDDGGEQYSASISKTVSGSQLANILNYAKNYKSTYHLSKYNCSDFGIEVGNLAGLNLPDAYGSWPGGGGSNPGTLGTHVRSRSSNSNITVNKSGGKAPATKKGC